MQLKWSHVFVYVQNLEAMLDFYTRVLGFRITDRGEVDGNELVFMSQVETDHHQIAFAPTRKDMARSNNVAHFAFRVAHLDDVKALHATLANDERVQRLAPVAHGNAWSIYFNDPEGNNIEVFCDTPFHVSQPVGGTWNPNSSNEDIRAQNEAEHRDAPGFAPIEEFYAAHAQALGQQEATEA